jgi:hypothetical protein
VLGYLEQIASVPPLLYGILHSRILKVLHNFLALHPPQPKTPAITIYL